MGCATGCLRAILVIFNIIFMLIALVFLGAGVAALFLSDMAQSFVDEAMAEVPSIISSLGAGPQNATYPDNLDGVVDATKILKSIAIPLLVLGGVMFIMCICGCCGACCGVSVMLIIYAILLVIVTLAQVIGIALLFTGKFEGEIKKPLESSLEKYGGIASFNFDSVLWSFLMMQFECCGLEGGTAEWENRPEWYRYYIIEEEGFERNYTMQVPFACCKLDGEFPDFNDIYNETCITTGPNDYNSHYNTGCWGVITDEIRNFESPTMAGIIGAILVQLLLIVMTILVICFKDKVGVM